MSLLRRLFDQINMADGGKTFNSPQPQQGAPLDMRQAQQAIMTGGLQGEVGGLQSGARRPMLPMRRPMRRMQEDDAMVQGPQGLNPINADVANFRNPSLQPFGRGYEDEYTPAAALENTGYINPQTSRNGMFLQQGNDPYRLRNYLNY